MNIMNNRYCFYLASTNMAEKLAQKSKLVFYINLFNF